MTGGDPLTSDAAKKPDTVPRQPPALERHGSGLDRRDLSWDEYYQAIIDAVFPSCRRSRNHRVETLESGERVDLRGSACRV